MIKKIDVIFKVVEINGYITVDEACNIISASRITGLQVIRALLIKKVLIVKNGKLYLP